MVGGAMGASRDGGRTLEPVVLIVIQCGGQKSYSVSRRLVRLRNRLGTGAAPGGSFRLVHFGNFQRKFGRKSKILLIENFGFTFALAAPPCQKSYWHGNAPQGRRVAPAAALADLSHPPGMCAGRAAPMAGRFN